MFLRIEGPRQSHLQLIDDNRYLIQPSINVIVMSCQEWPQRAKQVPLLRVLKFASKWVGMMPQGPVYAMQSSSNRQWACNYRLAEANP